MPFYLNNNELDELIEFCRRWLATHLKEEGPVTWHAVYNSCEFYKKKRNFKKIIDES